MRWFLVLFLVVSSLAPAQDFTNFSFSRLTELSYDSQIIWIEGFLIGVFHAALLANKAYGLNAGSAEEIMILDENPRSVLEETYAWYSRTRSWKTPLYIAIYRRKLDY